MNELKPEISYTVQTKDFMEKVGKGLAIAIEKHPDRALIIAGSIGVLYVLKDKRISFKMKKGDMEVEFKSE